MEGDVPPKSTIPDNLRAELDQSRQDLVAGRTEPLAPVLTAIHARATRRVERKAESEGRNRAKLG